MSAIRVKFVAKMEAGGIDALWRPLLPDGSDRIGDCVFTFDAEARDYDFLAVYEDLPPRPGERQVLRREPLACARANTLLLTTEPSSIRIDGPAYLRQFGHVWTSRHASLAPHPNRVPGTPPLRFFYGRNMAGGAHRPLSDAPPAKSKDLSGMSSTKAMAHTVHAKRLEFMLALKDRLGARFDLYGRGLRPVDDKAEAMSDYRYHVAVENHVEPGHFTEKLTDCFVAGCLPFYYGDPDYARVFPAEAVLPIDIYDLDGTVARIERAIAQDEFMRRRSALAEARRTALERFNTLRAVARTAEAVYDPDASRGGELLGRHAFRKAHPVKAVSDAVFRMRARKSPLSDPLQRNRAD
ncbi:glycosyltransferase family 10 [uncultured Algimonas sp.]|uniref:glycosyltransferase family 10 domain-containing protein n=1 Tax=uncultured Algimonas sp. TaxID=1547920 RepID=UPI002634CD45|nr:glycosyltransferase family 10 [uncultured Algimonas sp.]